MKVIRIMLGVSVILCLIGWILIASRTSPELIGPTESVIGDLTYNQEQDLLQLKDDLVRIMPLVAGGCAVLLLLSLVPLILRTFK